MLVIADYNPSATTTTAAPSGGQAAAASESDDCDRSSERWKWKCMTSAERALLVCVVILLIVCVCLCLAACLYYCNCVRPREKVAPKVDEEYHRNSYISPETGKVMLADHYVSAIPYEKHSSQQFPASASDSASFYASGDEFTPRSQNESKY